MSLKGREEKKFRSYSDQISDDGQSDFSMEAFPMISVTDSASKQIEKLASRDLDM
jgi:hypothetical protein